MKRLILFFLLITSLAHAQAPTKDSVAFIGSAATTPANWRKTGNNASNYRLQFLGLPGKMIELVTGYQFVEGVGKKADTVAGGYVKRSGDSMTDSLDIYRQMRVWNNGYVRTALSGNLHGNGGAGIIQAIAGDGTNYYEARYSGLAVYNSSWTLIASNNTPFAGVISPNVPDHLSAIRLKGNKIYTTAVKIGSGLPGMILVYDKSTLALIEQYQMPTGSPSTGIAFYGDKAYINKYSSGTHMYTLDTATFSVLDSIQFSTRLTYPQGIDYANGRMWHFTLSGVYSSLPDGTDVQNHYIKLQNSGEAEGGSVLADGTIIFGNNVSSTNEVWILSALPNKRVLAYSNGAGDTYTDRTYITGQSNELKLQLNGSRFNYKSFMYMNNDQIEWAYNMKHQDDVFSLQDTTKNAATVLLSPTAGRLRWAQHTNGTPSPSTKLLWDNSGVTISTLYTGLTNTSVPYIGPSGLLSNDPNNLFWNTSSKILTVAGGASGANNVAAVLQNSGGTAANTSVALALQNTTTLGSTTYHAQLQAIRTNTGGAQATDLAFSVHNGSSLMERLRIAANGNVSLNTITTGTAGTDPIVVRSTSDGVLKTIAANYYATSASLSGYVPTTRTVSAGNGLSGGGALSANITLSADTSVLRTALNSWTKAQADARYLKLSGGALTGNLTMGNNSISGVQSFTTTSGSYLTNGALALSQSGTYFIDTSPSNSVNQRFYTQTPLQHWNLLWNGSHGQHNWKFTNSLGTVYAQIDSLGIKSNGAQVATVNDTATFVPKAWPSGIYTISGNRRLTGTVDYTGLNTYIANGVSTTTDPTNRINLSNATAATVGTQRQTSPSIKWSGAYWNTGSSSNQPISYEAFAYGNSSGSGSATLSFKATVNGGSTYPLSIRSDGSSSVVFTDDIQTNTITAQGATANTVYVTNDGQTSDGMGILHTTRSASGGNKAYIGMTRKGATAIALGINTNNSFIIGTGQGRNASATIDSITFEHNPNLGVTKINKPTGTNIWGVDANGYMKSVLPAYSSGTILPVVYNSTNDRFETTTGATDNVLSKSADYTIVSGDFVGGKKTTLDLYVDTSSGNVVITLPTYTSFIGYTIYVTKTDASANTVTINTVVGNNVLAAQYQTRQFNTAPSIGWVNH